MQNLPLTMLDQINHCYDLSLSTINALTPDTGNTIQIESQLYNQILAKTQNEFGCEVLQFGISPESYMRYKNGKVSSIVKGDSGFQSHEGFEAVKIVNIVDSVFGEVSQHLTNQVLSSFTSLTNQIFTSLNSMHTNLINQTFYMKEQEHVEDMASFKDFFEEINDELGTISNSPTRCTAYISQIIDIRRNTYKTYNYFVNKLLGWPATIGATNILNNDYCFQVDFNALHKDYFLCRQAISCYMISLVYEYVIAGNIDNKSCEKIVTKVESFLSKFRQADSQIKSALYQRDNANRTFNWLHYFRQDKQNDSNAINWFLNQYKSDDNFEITKIKDVFEESKNLLSSIQLVERK